MARFDIKRVAEIALDHVGAVLDHWAPGGSYQGQEYVTLNPSRIDSNKGSFSVNRSSGAWGEFAGEEKGGDLVSLVAYLDGTNNGEAAQRLAAFLGMSESETTAHKKQSKKVQHRAAKDEWEGIFPVPRDALKSCPARHPRNGAPSFTWDYKNENGRLLMKVMRFDVNNAGQRSKDYRPLLYCINSDGIKAWRWMQPKHSRPLYGLDRLAARPDAPVLLTEGEKACDAASELMPEYICATWPGGSKALAKVNLSPLKGRHVLLWPDNDKAGTECMQMLGGQLHELGCRVSVVCLKALGTSWPVKADAADAESQGITTESLAKLLETGELTVMWNQTPCIAKDASSELSQNSEGGTTTTSCGFMVSDKGVYFRQPSEDGDNPPIRICDRLDMMALTRDHQGRNWGTLVRFIDPDGVAKELNIPSEYLATEGGAEVLRQLMGMGLRAEAGQQPRRRLIQYLQTARPAERYTLVNRLGWHGNAYLMPDCTLGTPKEPLHFYSNNPDLNKIKVRGDLSLWRQNVSALCINNTRLLFAISAAFAGPLLHLIGMETTGFHFVGDSSQGKTTLLKLAASVYGGSDFVRTWRSTDNALESIAAAHSDGLLILDEISQCDPRLVGDITYMLGNGSGKARANDRGGARSNGFEWRLVFLSTGERTLDQQMSEAGKRSKAGQEIRLLSIPADAGSNKGIFDNLHNFAGGAALSTHLAEQAAINHGYAIYAFIEKLCASNAERLAARIRGEIVNFCKNLADDTSGQVRRAAEKFAIVGYAGELASQANITGWPKGAALAAAKTCFDAWVSMRGGVGNLEDQQTLSAIRLYFDMHGESNFTRWDRDDYTSDDHQVRTLKRCGFRKTIADANALEGKSCSETVYYVYAEAWKSEICTGINERKAKQLLAECGALERDAQGGFTVPTRIPGGGRTPSRMVVIRPHLIQAREYCAEATDDQIAA